MNRRQLEQLGVPGSCTRSAMTAVQSAAKAEGLKRSQLKAWILRVVEHPEAYVGDRHFDTFARELIEDRDFVRPEPVSYRTWGDDIDVEAHKQMQQACAVPPAVGAALMPDAHLGYGLPIGGVLALENAIIPYAVGVDIACRMKMSVLDVPVAAMESQFGSFRDALEKGTRFGVGSQHERRQDHAVMDQDWTVSKVTREKKDKAWAQLGTSGSGNHFAEFGLLTLRQRDEELGLDAGAYTALLTHSGSRGTGAAVCSVYSDIARSMLPARMSDFARLGWLTMDSQEGIEYWKAMNLMGDYAAANHDVIHRLISRFLGASIISGVENHHNFAWLEHHNGRETVVHRKGATPAGAGVLGVIPGSMADPAYVVRGKGCAESLNSASHGAGRRMSRKKAKDTYRFNAVRNDLAKKGVHILSAGADEVPGVYKNIEDVMAAQRDLVDIVARFDPRIVKMCGDGSRAED